MSTLDLIMAAAPSVIRPAWCQKDALGPAVVAMLWEPGRGELGLQAIAKTLDEAAQLRGWSIGEVARVRKGVFEGVYARAAETTAA